MRDVKGHSGAVGCPGSGVQSVQDARTRGEIRVPRLGALSHIPASPASAGGGASGSAGLKAGLCPRPGRAGATLGGRCGLTPAWAVWQGRGTARARPG